MYQDLKDMYRSGYDFIDGHRVLVGAVVGLGISLALARRYYQGGVCRSRAMLHKKTVLITGANTGIGKETARELARRGARVLLACRDITKAERAAEEIRRGTGNTNVAVYIMDLASLASVRKCASDVIAKEKRLDILINNAGVMWCPEWRSEDGYEMQFAVNHLGHFLFTHLLLDLLKSSSPSRIINVSSLAHQSGKIDFEDINGRADYSPSKAYSQSKLANVLFTRELSRRLEGTHVTANSLHPGAIVTELVRHLPVTANLTLWKWILVRPALYIFCKTVPQGAQTTIHCAVAEELNGVTGKYFSDCVVKEEAPQAKDDDVAKRLWDLSLDLVGITSTS